MEKQKKVKLKINKPIRKENETLEQRNERAINIALQLDQKEYDQVAIDKVKKKLKFKNMDFVNREIAIQDILLTIRS